MANNDFMDPMDPMDVPENDPELEEILNEADNLLEENPAEEPIAPEADWEEQGAPENWSEDQEEFSQDLDDLLGEPLDVPQRQYDQEKPDQEEFRDQEYRDTFGDDLDRAFADEEEPEEPQEEEPEELAPAPARRKTPKKPKKGSGLFGLPHFVATILYFAVVIAISVTLARIVWLCADDMLALHKEDKAVTVTILETDTMDQIADKLVDAGLVKYKNVFLKFAELTSARQKISAGTFELNAMYDYHALISGMSRYSAFRTVTKVMIPEGYNCRQIFELLEEKGVCSAEDLEAAAMESELTGYWFLDGVERDDPYCLEGFLFPDTYEFYEGDEPERVLEKLLDTFDYRFNETLQNDISRLNDYLAEKMRENGYDDGYIESHRYTIQKIITVASLIEKETASHDESPMIASVIYNRLTNARDYPYLNIDATILYALGEHKEALSLEDLQIDSPYNTYTNPGLPVGPIANPGLNSIQAALHPEDTGYYYYALDEETKMHHFSETYEEHNEFLQSQGD